MEEIFLSTKNIANLTKKLIINLDLDEKQVNRDTVIKCKKIKMFFTFHVTNL